ncbi:MAG: N-acetylmannosamine-6-phosphate 2-epimerase [Firmicutes bacterium]|nr:N-acetylmannosamine-6-phosphate 2-epimerase [Bacillota bacterium]MDD4263318.1 N-acetylmannosamine-6-phosphate 2-epimerase [Bacillota bacterium]MDD4693781.1 N-acetylmannosamine-6-phosphate 2-epimerase [Bacillota bacterium]
MSVLDQLKGGLVVSCQAKEGSPFRKPVIMAAMAKAAEQSGAVGIRANGYDDIKAIREEVNLPIIGILKNDYPGFDVYITPTFEDAKLVASAGADIIAIDATPRKRPNGETFKELIDRIHDELNLLVMADCSTAEEGLQAAKLGADIVATTMSGYTEYSKETLNKGPDVAMLQALVENAGVPVIAEGRFNEPGDVQKALSIGALAVVVGTALTAPEWRMKQFTEVTKPFRK